MWYSDDHMSEVIAPDSVTNKGGLYLGDISAAEDLMELKSKGITHVLTLLGDHDKVKLDLQGNGIDHKVIEAYDGPRYLINAHFGETYEFIELGRKKGNVFVHCYAGAIRSPTIVIAYLIKSTKESAESCYYLVKSKRERSNPHQGFLNQLIQYSIDVKSHPQINAELH